MKKKQQLFSPVRPQRQYSKPLTPERVNWIIDNASQNPL